MRPTAAELALTLGLAPHQEGGVFRETYRAAETVSTPRGERVASTAILFLVTAAAISHLHRLASDELWVFQGGLPLEVVSISPHGRLEARVLGDPADGTREAGGVEATPLALVPAGSWQGACLAGGPHLPASRAWALVSCIVSPGFEYEDFELGERDALLAAYPEHADALCERVRELRRGRPLAPLTIVVGSSNVRTRVGDLLVRRLGAVANVSVVTLSRLAADLVAAVRGTPQPTLAGSARERLLRRLIAARELAYFAPVQDRPHFPQAVAATFADLREARVAAASGWARAALGQGAVADTPSGAAKAADLQGLYGAYCDDLARRGLADGAQLLLDAASAVRGAHAKAGAPAAPGAFTTADDPAARPRVVLYGIYDLNQAQEALVAELLGAGADLFVPIPRGGSGEGAGALEAARAAGLAEQCRETPAAGADLERLAELWRASRPVSGPCLLYTSDA